MEVWETSNDQELYANRVMRVMSHEAENPRNGLVRDYFRIDFPDWVNVLAINEQEEVLLIKQFRHGSRRIEYEIPGGCIDPGEDPVKAGMRELLEETGCSGENPQLLGRTCPNPALQGNWCYTVFTESAQQVADPELESGEDIEFEWVKLSEIPAFIADGRMTNAMVVAAFYALNQR